MKIKNIIISIVIITSLTRCGFYDIIENFQGCKDYYALSTKEYKINISSDMVADAWEKEGYKIQRDTFFSDNQKWMSPQIKIFNYKNPEIKVNINYILFSLIEFRKTGIQLHGICLKEKPKADISIKELKKINEIIRKEFVDRFQKK